MSIIALILTIAFMGFIVWIVLQLPIPILFKNIIYGVMAFALIVFLLQALGVDTGLGAVRFR